MLQKMTRTNEKGFTLIELMIVIAIIGILAAIAIPNFIAYRNKAFCSAAETDAQSVAAAIADYFSIPSHIATPASTDELNGNKGVSFSGPVGKVNSATIAGADPNLTITITVTDASLRCPTEYKAATPVGVNAKAYWTAGTVAGTFVKVIKPGDN